MADRGAVVDFDFAVANGAEVLFQTAKRFLKELDGIKLDASLEARYLAGKSYKDGFERLFASVKTKKTAQKAAREFAAAFPVEMAKAVPAAVGQAFRNFVKALVEKGVKVVIVSRAEVETVKAAFDFVPEARIAFYRETSDCYGTCPWDSWRRACHAAQVDHRLSLAVAGSGFGVKAALHAGMGAVGVIGGRVAYQDFGGADDVVEELSGKTAKNLLRAMRIDVK